MNLLSMAAVAVVAAEPELKWVSLWLRVRWAAVLVVLVAAALVLLPPLASVEEHCHALFKGLSLLKARLGLGYVGVAQQPGQSTGLSVTSGRLQLLVLKPKASPGGCPPGCAGSVWVQGTRGQSRGCACRRHPVCVCRLDWERPGLNPGERSYLCASLPLPEAVGTWGKLLARVLDQARGHNFIQHIAHL